MQNIRGVSLLRSVYETIFLFVLLCIRSRTSKFENANDFIRMIIPISIELSVNLGLQFMVMWHNLCGSWLFQVYSETTNPVTLGLVGQIFSAKFTSAKSRKKWTFFNIFAIFPFPSSVDEKMFAKAEKENSLFRDNWLFTCSFFVFLEQRKKWIRKYWRKSVISPALNERRLTHTFVV